MNTLDGVRKARSDKKKAIAAPLDRNTIEQIAHISYVCDLPAKSIAEIICREGIRSTKVLQEIRGHFRRDLQYGENQCFFGDMNKPSFKLPYRACKRLYMRYYQFEHDKFSTLAYALDCSVQVAAALLITTSMKRSNIVYPVLGKHIQMNMDKQRLEKLKSLCRQLDMQSQEEFITVPMVIAHAIRESLEKTVKVQNTLNKWII